MHTPARMLVTVAASTATLDLRSALVHVAQRLVQSEALWVTQGGPTAPHRHGTPLRHMLPLTRSQPEAVGTHRLSHIALPATIVTTPLWVVPGFKLPTLAAHSVPARDGPDYRVEAAGGTELYEMRAVQTGASKLRRVAGERELSSPGRRSR